MTDLDFFTSPTRGCAPGKGAHPEIFFANPRTVEEEGEKTAAKHQRDQARRICRETCPFTAACFTWARQHNETAGIWGGVDMASDDEKNRASVHYGLSKPAPAPVVEPESDDVLIERVLKAGPASFAKLTGDQKTMVVRAGLNQRMSWASLERKFRVSSARLKAIAGGDASPSFEQQVRMLYHAGKSDFDIALSLDCDPKRVFRARAQLGLPALFGPGGRLRRRIVGAQKVRREQVPA